MKKNDYKYDVNRTSYSKYIEGYKKYKAEKAQQEQPKEQDGKE